MSAAGVFVPTVVNLEEDRAAAEGIAEKRGGSSAEPLPAETALVGGGAE
jgi:hypothetical protein